jgi:predicted TIM-barrel fold metal-dependent hydrolase
MIIDFHNHFYPPEFIQAVRKGPSNFRVTDDEEGNPVLHSPGDYNVVVPGHRDIEYRTRVLNEAEVDMQVITFTAPGTYLETSDRAPYLASLVNDALAKIVEERGDRFTSLAHLPLTVPAAAPAEAERAITQLGFRGFMPFGNVNGVPLADERFWPPPSRPHTWSWQACRNGFQTSNGPSGTSEGRSRTSWRDWTGASMRTRSPGKTSPDRPPTT